MKRFLLLGFTVLMHLTLSAQDGSHDLTFNPNDIGLRYGDGPYNTAVNPYPYFNRVAVQADGKIICAGLFTEYNGKACQGIIRLTADGLFDTTFNPSGQGLFGGVNAIVIQADGKIIVGGQIGGYNGANVTNVIRLNTDGSLDAGFNIDLGESNVKTVTSLAIQPDGKILIGGNFPKGIIRVDQNGVADAAFDIAEYAFNQADINSMGLQTDGKIIVSGNFQTFSETSKKRLLRLNANGSIDNTFDTTVGANEVVREAVVLPDNKIVIIGAFTFYNDTYRPNIARLTANGLLDNTFNPGTFFINGANLPTLSSILVQPDGKLLINGKFKLHSPSQLIASATPAGNLVRLNANGTRDVSFDQTGADAQVLDVALQANGNVISVGWFESYDNVARRRVARSFADGNVDMAFNTGSGANSSVSDIKVLPDGKIMIAGDFRLYNGVVRNRIARLFADGTLDASFNSNLLIDSSIKELIMQPDGKILIMGYFTQIGSASRGRIARLNADGSLDTTFNVGTGFPATTFMADMALQSDGKVIVVGGFITYNGLTANRIVRLNPNGSIDTSFNIGTGANDYVGRVYVQADGKIIICGSYYYFNGVPVNGILRLNANGSIDTSFTPGSGLQGNVSDINILADGKIIIAGNLDTYNGANVANIIRLHPNGVLDTTFQSYILYGNGVTSVAMQSDGSMILGGDFSDTSWGLKNVVKINASGTVDESFNSNMGSGINETVSSVALQQDGKIIVAGDFDAVDGVGRNRIARLNNTGTLNVRYNSAAPTNIVVYTANDRLWVESKDFPLQSVAVYDVNGKMLYQDQNLNHSKFAIDHLKRGNQLLILKFTDRQGKVSVLKTVF